VEFPGRNFLIPNMVVTPLPRIQSINYTYKLTKDKERGKMVRHQLITCTPKMVASVSNQSHEVTDHITIATHQEAQLVDDSI
jgi:hypothetical protein